MLAGTDDHLTRLSAIILNLESTGLIHLEFETRVNGLLFANACTLVPTAFLRHGKTEFEL